MERGKTPVFCLLSPNFPSESRRLEKKLREHF
jgi:hypothetical protein